MLSLRSLILSDLHCFDLNLIDDEVHNDNETVTTKVVEVQSDDDEFYSMVEQRKANLNERLSQEIQSDDVPSEQVQQVSEKPRYLKKVTEDINLK